MTKRRLANELDNLSDEMLGDLGPADRLELALTASAKGKAEWMEQLQESCPRARYRQPEVTFTMRQRFAFTLVQQAVYDLRTTTYLLGWAETRARATTVLAVLTDLDPGEFGFDASSRETPATLSQELYVSYEGYTRFADAVLGVDLDEWLAVHPDGPTTVALAEALVDEFAGLRETAEDEAGDGDDKKVSLDDRADQRAANLQETWDEVVSGLE